GITLANDIVIGQPNAGNANATTSALQYLTATSGSSTLTGTITVLGDSLTNGDFGGANGGDFLNINGPVNTAAAVHSVSVWSGRVAFGGGGTYPQLDIFGTTLGTSPGIAFLNANNGLNTGALVNLVAGTLDMNGNNQTLAGLIGAAGGVA